MPMSKLATSGGSRRQIGAWGASAAFAYAVAAFWPALAAQEAPIPNFAPDSHTGWLKPPGDEFLPPDSGPGPVRSDPAHPYVSNAVALQETIKIADVTNPILQPWVVEQMRKANAEVLAGKVGFTARSRCWPHGVPGFLLYPVHPIFFIQTSNQVVMTWGQDFQLRHVYLDVPHSASPKPSWYGESVGRYDGDTLALDTIGLNDKTFIDNYRTPHSEKLHVTERWRMIEGGKTMEVNIRIEDPVAFNEPWSAVQHYRRVQQEMIEEACAENNAHLFDYHIPIADKADF